MILFMTFMYSVYIFSQHATVKVVLCNRSVDHYLYFLKTISNVSVTYK